MVSNPITSWEIDGETVETVADFIFLGSKITADGDCSHEIKRGLLLGRKVMTNLDNILKSRDITLPTKVCLVEAILMKVKVESETVGLKLNEDHGIWSHHFMANRWRNSGNSVRLYFFGLQNHCRW